MDKSLFNIKSAKIKEFLRYAVVGCVNTLIYYISYLVFMNIFNFSYRISFIAGYVISIIFSYFLNTYFTYKVKPSLKKFLLFPLTYIPNFIIQYIGMILLVDYLNMDRRLAPIITAIVSTPINFFIMRYIIKKKK